MLMNNHGPQELCHNGDFTLTVQELQLALTAIGDRADALLKEASERRDQSLYDEAWEHINLYNKICACTSLNELRTPPRPRNQRKKFSRRAQGRF